MGYSGLNFRTNSPDRTNIWADDNVTLIHQGKYEALDSLLPVEDERLVVNSFNLFNNYPNPFNPSTVIRYELPENSNVTITVFDVIGNEVATLVNELKPAGSYEVNFNGRNLSSGVYYYRLKAGSFIETKKFVLIK